jgi:tetratricopeptide (TPR) repeat protein
MYFENRSADPDLDKDIVELLTANLGRYNEIEVVGSQRLFDILRGIDKEGVEIIDKSNATEIANRAGVKTMMMGSIIEIGDRISITSQISDVQTGAIIGSEQVEGAQVGDIFRMVDELTEKVRENLQIYPEDYPQFKVADVTTDSFDAYRLFRKGRENIIRWDFDTAIKNFKQAIALDSTFALAHLYLAVAESAYGIQIRNPLFDLTKARNAISNAKRYRTKANDKERRLIDIYEALLYRNYEAAYVSSEDMVNNYPNEKDATLLLARTAMKAKKFDRSVKAYEMTLEIDPTFDEAYLEQAHTNSRINNHEIAISAIKKHMALQPDVWNPYDSAWEINMKAGEYDEAIRISNAALKLDASLAALIRFYEFQAYAYLFKGEKQKAFDILNQSSRLDPEEKQIPKDVYERWLAGRLGILLIYEGRYNEALAELQKRIELARQRSSKRTEMLTLFDRGKLLAEVGQYDEALEELLEGEELATDLYQPTFNPIPILANYLAGIAMVKKKDYSAAIEFADRIMHLINNESFDALHENYYHLLMAEMHVSQSDSESAINALEQVTVDGEFFSPRYRMLLASSFSLAGKYEEAIEVYSDFKNAIETSIYGMGDTVFYFLERAKIDYSLARIYEQQSNTDKAIEHYDKFLDLWKNADPGIAEVEDAKTRLKSLTDARR